MDYKNILIEKISKNVNLDKNIINRLIEIPPKQELGDYAFPCFHLAKKQRKAPTIIAEDLRIQLGKIKGFDKVEAVGAYVNFFIERIDFMNETIERILSEKELYGNSIEGDGKTVIVEYCSTDIIKPFQPSDLFTTILGNSLYNIFKSQGYNTIGINPIDDFGIQLGKLIYAYNHWGNSKSLEKEPIKEMLRIYMKFHEEAEINPDLNEDGRKHFKLLEEGNEAEVALWAKFKEVKLKEIYKLFKLLNIKFHSFEGKSFYRDKIEAVILELEAKDLLMESNGAKVIILEQENMPPYIIKKSDEANICATRNLASAIYRKKTYDFHKNIYVAAKEQNLHFKQVFTTIKKMGYDWAEDCIHVPFGLVRFPEQNQFTTIGHVVLLEDLLHEAILKTEAIINEKNNFIQDKREIAKKVGIGAVIFTYLKNSREKDIIFDWKEMLSFEGETGPYVQYTYSIGKNILEKSEYNLDTVDCSTLSLDEEFKLVKLLSNFNCNINHAIEMLNPSILTRYIIDITKALNKVYSLINIYNLQDEIDNRARLTLVKAALQVIENGLKLLGLEIVEGM